MKSSTAVTSSVDTERSAAKLDITYTFLLQGYVDWKRETRNAYTIFAQN
jgi:hypothetical protein